MRDASLRSGLRRRKEISVDVFPGKIVSERMSVVRMVSHDRSRSRTFGCRCPVMDRNARVSTGREIVFSRFRKATDIRCGKHVVRNIRRIAESPGGSGERAVCGFSVPEQGRCRVLCSDSSRQECMKKEVSGTCRTLLHVSGRPESCSGLRKRDVVREASDLSCSYSVSHPDSPRPILSEVRGGRMYMMQEDAGTTRRE